MQPNLNFFLYADSETILARKKELEPLAIEKLTKDYLRLFGLLNKGNAERYFPIENNDLNSTLNFISNKTQTKLIWRETDSRTYDKITQPWVCFWSWINFIRFTLIYLGTVL